MSHSVARSLGRSPKRANPARRWGWRSFGPWLGLLGGLAVHARAQSGFPDPSFHFWAMNHNAASYFEPTVAVGPSRILQAGNKLLACYDNTVSQSASENTPLWKAHLKPDEDTGFGPYFWNDGAGGCYDPDANGNCSTVDARVLFDPFRQRFIAVIVETSAQAGNLLLAISKDATPDGPGCDDWHKFVLDAEATNTNFHFLGLAVNPEAIYVTAQYQNAGGSERGTEVQILKPLPAEPWTFDQNHYQDVGTGKNRVLRRIPLSLAGDPVSHLMGHAMPAEFFDTSLTNIMYFAQLVDQGLPGPDPPAKPARIRLSAITTTSSPFDAGQPTQASDFQVTLTNEGSPYLAEQQCFAGSVDTKGNILNIAYQNGRLYFAHVAVKTGAHGGRYVARWYIVNTNGWPASGAPSMEHCGVVDGGRVFYEDQADRPVHYIFPYFMPTAAGDAALFLTRVQSKEHVGVYWAGRRAGDPANTLGAPLTLMKAGTAGVSVPDKWGEYLGIARDPGNGNTIWAVGELGRCLTSLPPCNICVGGGTYQDYFHTVIGNYAVPPATTHPVRRLTLQQPTTVPPSAVAVLVMPPDIAALDDASLPATPGATALRDFGHGTNVTLRAPPTLDGWTFSHWIVNNTVVVPPPSPTHRISVQMLGDRTVKPVYDAP